MVEQLVELSAYLLKAEGDKDMMWTRKSLLWCWWNALLKRRQRPYTTPAMNLMKRGAICARHEYSRRKETMKKSPELQTLMTGIAFGESPRWHDDRLWFSDWGAQEVIAVDLEGKSEVIVRVPTVFHFALTGYPTGACLSSRGAMGFSCAGSSTGRW